MSPGRGEAAENQKVRAVGVPDTATWPHRRFFWLLSCGWTIAVACSFIWNLSHNARELRQLTVQTAEALIEKDLLYREWSILHGGVYVPKGEQAAQESYPNDPEREIVTPSGQQLTLLNPALVSRQIFELQDRQFGIQGRITSLRPIRPWNQPDPWERQALVQFEQGETEVSGVEVKHGERWLRMMRPLVTVPSCLRCHEEEDQRPGRVRGGISVAVPMSRFSTSGENLHLVAAHSGLWVIGLTGIFFGANNLERHNQERRRALREKETLLQEIHHRVKNNLQVISSLLQIQCDQIKSAETQAVFRESQLRVRAMALIHEKLYESESLARIDLADYLRSLADLLVWTYAGQRDGIRLELALSPALVSIDTAIPLGLIANELIANSLKYAFPDGRKGLIRVQLESVPGDRLQLRVADDGIGLPEGFDVETAASLGLRLIKLLTEQLEAEGTWEKTQTGTTFTLRFHDDVCENTNRERSSRVGIREKTRMLTELEGSH